MLPLAVRALVTRLLPVLSLPESPEAARSPGGRVPVRVVPTGLPPRLGLAAPKRGVEDVGRPAAAPDRDGRAVLDAGTAGGPMEVRVPPTDGRGRTVEEAARLAGPALEGVPVREVAVLDGPVASCFVGDFVGDRAMLVGRDRGTGLGLGALRLIRLARPVSPDMLVRVPAAPV